MIIMINTLRNIFKNILLLNFDMKNNGKKNDIAKIILAILT